MSSDWISRAASQVCLPWNLIDGRRRAGGADRLLEKYAPRDGQRLSTWRSAAPQDVEDAVVSTSAAHKDGRWERESSRVKAQVLQRLADLIEQYREDLALLESLETGKPISSALTVDVPAAARLLRFNAELVGKVSSTFHGADGHSLSYQLRRPQGVVAAVVGWNFPLVLAAGKIGPALAMGNSIILKPSELTPSSALRLAELALEAGLPPGVLNVLQGDGAVGAALSAHSKLDMIAFTGSTASGKVIMSAAGASNLKRVLLECGGKAPIIVMKDSPDLEAVARHVAHNAFGNQGEVCAAGSRLLVHRDIKKDLLRRVIEQAEGVAPGDPLDETTRFGALVSASHQKKVLRYLELGIAQGGKLAYRCASPPPFEHGYYVGPTVIDDVKSSHTIAQEEIFGPVLSVLEFSDVHEAIQIANDTIYGLSASVWTKDVGLVHELTRKLDAGWIVVNATAEPRSGLDDGVLAVGGHKQSGIGLEGGIEGAQSYTKTCTVQCYV